jgi:oligopeptide transport system substrate-binding protein
MSKRFSFIHTGALLLLASLLTAACMPGQPGAGEKGREQTLRTPLTEPPTLDPGLAEDNVSIDVISQLFEALVAFDDKGAISGLGAEKWDISADGLTYTFTLRQGPKWSDGKAVTAQDYAWAWRRNVSPKTASPYANTLFPVKNAEAINEGKLEPEQLGVEAKDDRTLVVTLEQPAAYFLRLASTWTLMPLRQDVIEKHGDKWTEAQNIVTNGLYLLKEWQHDTQIVLERNEDYWGAKPTLQKAIYRLYPEGGSDQVLAAYETGEIDTTGAGTSFELPPNQVDRILADSKLKEQVKIFDQSATNFITVNNRREHLKDPRVRIALGQALDRQRIIGEVLKRVGKPAYGLQPEGIVGRKPEIWPKDDPAAAKKLLAEAGYPDGRGFPEISFTYNTSAQWKPFAEHLQQRWKETLGINVKLDSMEWAVFLKWRKGDEWVQKGDLYRGGWFSDYEDPNNWYNVLWESRSDPLAFNSGWKNDRYDALAHQAAGELERSRRESTYGQAEELLAKEYPVIPVFHYSVRSLVKPYVQNFQPERVLGITPLKKISLSS